MRANARPRSEHCTTRSSNLFSVSPFVALVCRAGCARRPPQTRRDEAWYIGRLAMGSNELELQKRLSLIVKASPWLLDALEIIKSQGLPDWYLAAGAIRNTVWDALHGWVSMQPQSDLDVIYFDPGNPQNAAEMTLQVALPEYTWEVTNQATVHHWQSGATNRAVPPYESNATAMASWPETATAVGVRLTDRGMIESIAPHGLADLFDLTLRPSPTASDPTAYESRLRQKAWHLRWPRLRILQS